MSSSRQRSGGVGRVTGRITRPPLSDHAAPLPPGAPCQKPLSTSIGSRNLAQVARTSALLPRPASNAGSCRVVECHRASLIVADHRHETLKSDARRLRCPSPTTRDSCAVGNGHTHPNRKTPPHSAVVVPRLSACGCRCPLRHGGARWPRARRCAGESDGIWADDRRPQARPVRPLLTHARLHLDRLVLGGAAVADQWSRRL